MSLEGINNTDGTFVAKTEDQIRSETQAQLNLIVDPVVPGNTLQVNLYGSSVVAQIVNITVTLASITSQLTQVSFDQYNDDNATGQSLAGLTNTVAGIIRKEATSSFVLVTITGQPNIVIPVGELVITDINYTNDWVNTEEITTDNSGNRTGIIMDCQTLGAITAVANSLTVFSQSNAALNTVTNPTEASVGSNQQSDVSLRLKFDNAKNNPALGSISAVQSNISQLDNVLFVSTTQNLGYSGSELSIPLYTCAAVVSYNVTGEDEVTLQRAIAKIIITYGGFAFWNGEQHVTYFDDLGIPKDANFYKAAPISVFLEVTIKVLNVDEYPEDGPSQIENNIITFSLGGAPALGITDGFRKTGFLPGNTVILDQLQVPILKLAGIEITDLKIGKTPTLGIANLDFAFNEFAFFSATNITIIET